MTWSIPVVLVDGPAAGQEREVDADLICRGLRVALPMTAADLYRYDQGSPADYPSLDTATYRADPRDVREGLRRGARVPMFVVV